MWWICLGYCSCIPHIVLKYWLGQYFNTIPPCHANYFISSVFVYWTMALKKPISAQLDKGDPYCGNWETKLHPGLTLKRNLPLYLWWCPHHGKTVKTTEKNVGCIMGSAQIWIQVGKSKTQAWITISELSVWCVICGYRVCHITLVYNMDMSLSDWPPFSLVGDGFT